MDGSFSETTAKSLFNTTRRRSRPSFFSAFLLRAPFWNDVPVLLLNHSILQSRSKIDSNLEALHKYYEIYWINNLSYHWIYSSKPEIYFFRSGKRMPITKFSFFADNPFKNKHALFGWWDQKWRETEINASSSCENKVLSLIGLRQETINCRW